MRLSRLKWYAARLAAMSPAEVAHRLREAALKRAWRGDRRGWDNFSVIGDGALADLSLLRARLGSAPPQDVAALDAGLYAGLGANVRADDPEVWFRDPVGGGVWPKDAYCFDIDVRGAGTDSAGGSCRADVKFVWEINRLQMLHPLCVEVAAGRAGPRRLLDVVHAWAAANPPYRGVNWFSGIELAMRLVTLTLVVAAVPPAALSDDDRIALRRMIAAHGFWLARYPSKHSSANNHLVAEGLGLLLAGLLAPDLADAPGWAAEGRHILEREAAKQIFPDGVGVEQSPTYQAFTMEMLAFGALVADMAGRPLDDVVRARLAAGATFLTALMDVAGLPPRIGDDDEGRVLAAPPDREPAYVASVVAAVAGLAGGAPLPPRRDPHLRDAVFAAPACVGGAPEGVQSFAGGGYTILRRRIAGRLAVLTFDHGPLGYLSLAAHGHADALAVWLSLDETPVLVDAGTFLYHSGGETRNALRRSQAHNTLTLGDVSQSVPSSAFSWSRKATARRDDLDPGGDFHVSGRHDGYRRLGITHRRRIDATPEGFAISDLLEGATTPLPATIAFLLAPDLDAMLEGGIVHIRRAAEPLLAITAPQGMRIRLARDEAAAGRGVHSAAFGDIRPTTQIVFEGPMENVAKTTRFRVLETPPVRP